jgi:hypothetical protein
MAIRSPVQAYMPRGSTLVTKPASEPVSVSDVKAQLQIDGTADDTILAAYITEAREEIEQVNGMAFITQTWRLSLDRWPSGKAEWWDGIKEGSVGDLYGPASFVSLAIPRYPLQTVSSVTVFDEDSNSTAVVIADTFDIDTYSLPGRMSLKFGATWPIALRSNNAIIIQYVAGYGAAADVPAAIKRAIKQMVAYMYTHRGDDCDPADAYQASGAAQIMGRYRVTRI